MLAAAVYSQWWQGRHCGALMQRESRPLGPSLPGFTHKKGPAQQVTATLMRGHRARVSHSARLTLPLPPFFCRALSVRWNKKWGERHRRMHVAHGEAWGRFLKEWEGDYMNKVWRWQTSTPSLFISMALTCYSMHVWADVWIMAAYICVMSLHELNTTWGVHADLRESWQKPFERKLQLRKICQKEENGERFGGFWDESELSQVFLWAFSASPQPQNNSSSSVVEGFKMPPEMPPTLNSFGITVLEKTAANFSPLALT